MDRSDLNQEAGSHAFLNVSNVFNDQPLSEQANYERIFEHTSAAVHRAAITRDGIGCPSASDHLEARYLVESFDWG